MDNIIDKIYNININNTDNDYKYKRKCEECDNLEYRLDEYEKRISILESQVKYITNTTINKVVNLKSFWNNIITSNINKYMKEIEYLLNEFGTKQPCNRFDVGNVIELILFNLIRDIGYTISHLPNARRIDLVINDKLNISVKYSSTGDITLHNSNGHINTDMNICNTLLLTTEKIYIISKKILIKYDIDVKDYLKNTGDSLRLKRKLLKKLDSVNYSYMMDIILNIDKSKCKNRLCSELFYESFKLEYNNSLK